ACWGGPLNNSIFCEEERIDGMSESSLNAFTKENFTTDECTVSSVGLPFEEAAALRTYHLRFINIKTALNTLKECKPAVIKPLQTQNHDVFSNTRATFSPREVGIEITEKPFIARIKQDPIPYIPIINPRSILPLVEDWRKDEVGLPSIKQEEIQAARLIVIRRKKMKKHQRRKLWKRMRHRWARNELLAMIKEANEFSAEQYVASKIEKANHNPLPTRWRHKRLPEFIIRQLLGIDKKINYHHTD
ncbi:hypothetical protein MSG28_012105, partial [Choristoneura fumiferana]